VPSLDTLLPADVRSEVSTVVFARGRTDALAGAVSDLARARQTLNASVVGSGRRPHRVRIAEDGQNNLAYACDCPHFRATESACRHVVATLLTWIDRRDGVRRLGGAGRHAGGAPERRREIPHDPLEPIYRGERQVVHGPLRPEDVVAALAAPSERWRWSARLDGDGPGLILVATFPESARGVAAHEIRYRVPPAQVPSVAQLLRRRAPAAWSEIGRRVKVRRMPARLRLVVDEQDDTIVLTPTLDFPGTRLAPRPVDPVDLFASADGITWTVHDLSFFPVVLDADGAAEAVLDGRLPARIEGTAIPAFLRDRLPTLAGRPGVAVAARVREHRILAGPALEAVRARADGAGPAAGTPAEEGDAPDWYWLDPIYRTGEYRVSLDELLAGAREGWLRRGRNWIPIDRDALLDDLAPVRAEASADGVRVPRVGLLRASATWEDSVRVERDSSAAALLDRVARRAATRPAPPLSHEAMRGALRPYQEVGYRWLWWLRESAFGGILADEMGLGKTHEVMALVAALHAAGAARGPALVVCPRSVLDHWETKVREYAPSLGPVVFHAGSRERDPAPLARARLVLTTYGILSRSADVLGSVEWDTVILDEAQKIKNAGTATARLARALRARHRLAMTGTPIENRASDLWSVMEFLMPGYLGGAEHFRRRFANPIAAGSAEALVALQRAVRPFKLRRLKQEVLPDLPRKVEDYRACRLSAHQAALYREILARRAAPLVERLKTPGARIDHIHVFAVLTLLKRLCDHPALVARGAAARAMASGKFEMFKELLEEILDAGEKVVVFSQYLEMLDLIEAHLRGKGVGFAGIRGKTTDRRGELRRFQDDPACRVFVGSLLAGGLGIDLTAASVVVHYDRWWNAAREDQATDRVHRIGQARGVQVWKLVTLGTIEERIDRIIRDKRALLETLVEADESEAFRMLTREDLIELLAPAR
jgi:superfamily II DNA or RNA helicase